MKRLLFAALMLISGPLWAQGTRPPIENFLGLLDTPDSYSGQAGKSVIVNPGATGLIFSSAGSGSVTSISALSPLFTTPDPITATGILSFIAPGLSGNLLTSNGTTWVSSPSNSEAPLTFSDSLNRVGDTINLDGDLPTPGVSKYYGTNAGNVKGWFALPAAGGVTSFNARTGAVMPDSADYSAFYALTSHNHTFASLTAKPTTLSGYGITDAQPLDTQLTDLAALAYATNGLKVLRVNSGATGWELATISAGGGTVTDFSAGDLSPLFTTTEATTTTTPALSFGLTAAAANTVFGRAAGTSGAPTYSSSPQFTAIGNLTGNGFIKTSGGVGTLSVDTATYLTGNQSISLTGDVTGGPAATSIATIYNNAVPTTKGGLPTGGTANQILSKIDGTNYNTQWVTPGGGGNVSNSGTPTVDQLGIWVTATTIKGLTTLPATNFPALTGDVTTTAGALGTTIGANKVTLGMMATMATDSILGRATASTGNVEVLTSLPFAWSGGDITRAADSNTESINADAVTYAKMQNVVNNNRFLGRISGAAGDVEELTAANAKTILALTSSDVGLGSVTNAAQTLASVVPNTLPAAGQILAGNAGGTAYAPVTVSGSGATISLASTGVMTIGSIANASLDSDLAAIGNITGARGDVLYYGATGWAKLAAGTNGNQLTTHAAGADPTWDAPATGGGSVTLTGEVTGSGTGSFATTISDTVSVGDWTLNATNLTGITNLLSDAVFSNGTSDSGVIHIKEDADFGVNVVSIRVPALAANVSLILPPDDGDANEVLTTNGTGTLTWETPFAANVPSLSWFGNNTGGPAAPAFNISVFPAALLPVFSGDVTKPNGTLTLTLANIPAATTIAGASGARGDILYYGASGWTKLAAGTAGNQLTTQGASADPTWSAAGSGGGGTPGGSDTQVQFNDATAFGGDADFTWGKTTNTLSLGAVGTGGKLTLTGTTAEAVQLSSDADDITLRNTVSGNRTNLRVMPNGSSVANYPSTFAFYGTDRVSDPSNYERLFIYAKGTSDSYYIIGTDATGTGTRRPLALDAASSGANIQLYLATDGAVGFGTTSPGGGAVGYLNVPSTGQVRWNNDTAIARNAAGVVEVNNGTNGTFRDLKSRTLLLNPSSAPTGVEGALYGNSTDHKIYYHNGTSFVDLTAGGAGGSGDVVGPASATDNAIARYDTTTGKLIQSSGAYIDDNGRIFATGGTTGGVFADTGAQAGISTNVGELRLNASGGLSAIVNGGGIQIDYTSQFTWNPFFGGADTGLYRNAAGVVEVNNGTAGQYRDLKARNASLTGGAGGTAALLVDDPGTDSTANIRLRDSNDTTYRSDINISSANGLQFNAYYDTGAVYRPITFDGNPIKFRFDAANTLTISATGADLASGKIITGNGTVPAGGTTGQVLKKNTNTDYDLVWGTGGGGSGDVVGPASAVADQVAVFDGTTGKLIKGATGSGIAKHTAGVLSLVTAPSGAIVGTTDTQTLTNKRITPRITTITSSFATPTINTDNCNAVTITGLNTAITDMSTNTSGTPGNFDSVVFRIKDSGTAQNITWGTKFTSSQSTLPTKTTAGKTLTVGFLYDSVSTKWECIAVDVEDAALATLQTGVINTAATGSTSYVMGGLGAAGSLNAVITPAVTGKMVITVSGSIYNTSTGGSTAQLRYGTGTAPANGAADTGTAVGGTAVRNTGWGANMTTPFSLTGIATGLTVGTPYWIDCAYVATANTSILYQVSVTAYEIP